MMANSPGPEKPLTPSLPTLALWHGAPSMCQKPICKCPGPTCSRNAPHQLLMSTNYVSNQHIKAVTWSPLRKKVFGRSGAGGERTKSPTGNLWSTAKTQPFQAGPSHGEHTVLPSCCEMLRLLGVSLLKEKGCHHLVILQITKFTPQLIIFLGFTIKELPSNYISDPSFTQRLFPESHFSSFQMITRMR